MLRFVIRKMLNKKWMVLALLIGNILLISIAAANPMYTEAVLQRTLESELSNYVAGSTHYPVSVVARVTNTVKRSDRDHVKEILMDKSGTFGLPMKELIEYNFVASRSATTDLNREDRRLEFAVGMLTDLEDHIRIVDGRLPANEPLEDGTVEVIVSEKGMAYMRLLLDETLTFEKYRDVNGDPLKVRVVGVFTNSEDTDPYWFNSPNAYSTVLMMPENLFEQIFMAAPNSVLQSTFCMNFDYSNIRTAHVSKLMNALTELENSFNSASSVRLYNYYSDVMGSFQKTESKVRTTFLVLQVPVFVLLAAFIFMVSKQLLDMEQGEIAVLKSRGAAKKQVIGVYLTQSLVTVVISYVIGILLGFMLVRVLGAASAFLEFVSRKSMLVVISPTALIYGAVAALFSVCTMVIPVFRFSSVTIVNHKQKKNSRRSDVPVWQKLFIDVILLGISLYGLFSFNNQKEILSQAVLDGKPLDPLLFLSSSLFMLGAGLFALRIAPYIVRLIFWIFKEKWSPALYTSFVRVIRTRKQQGFIMAFLVMTLALGVFDASAARTINNNDERNLAYMSGTDILLKEKWKDNAAAVQEDPSLELEFQEPDFGRYQTMPQVESAAKVFQSVGNVSLKSSGTLNNVSIMGIDSKRFGETASMEDGLLDRHWYEYLNAMALNSNGVILSSNFKTDYGYQINDVIYYRIDGTEYISGVIYGFVDCWPGYAAVSNIRGTDGVYSEKSNYMIVGSLAFQQKKWGIRPYEVWLKTNGSSQFIYDFIEEEKPELERFMDLSAEKVAHKNDAVLQGTNGILTVGFIVALVICTVGFLIYWILSIKSRELQFGIFRAMGMSMREIISMLINEHVFISGVSIAIGAVVGWLTSKLFMPLIQIAYSSAENVLPLMVVSDPADSIRLAIIIGAMIVLCFFILGWLIKKMKIAQALKLGED